VNGSGDSLVEKGGDLGIRREDLSAESGCTDERVGRERCKCGLKRSQIQEVVDCGEEWLC
jgi:hypothetical protein